MNSYVVRGSERNLVIDAGLNRDVCKKAMIEGLSQLGISLDSVDSFITHLYADHFGLVSELAGESTRVYFNRPDSELIEHWQGFEPMIQYGGQSGFLEDQFREALNQHPGFKYGTGWTPSMSMIQDGQQLEIGDYCFTCIHTPGHTDGHTCLYEKDKKILIAGDHVLYDITPNIQCWSDSGDPMGDCLLSLDKVRPLEVSRCLPGHRNLFECFADRIDELKEHHFRRLQEVVGILEKKSPQHAFDVASKMI